MKEQEPQVDDPIPTTCPAQFSKLGSLPGCYHLVLDATSKASWEDAEAACQTLHPQAHLVSLETQEV